MLNLTPSFVAFREAAVALQSFPISCSIISIILYNHKMGTSCSTKLERRRRDYQKHELSQVSEITLRQSCKDLVEIELLKSQYYNQLQCMASSSNVSNRPYIVSTQDFTK